jgi:hypothetical protein
MIISAPINYGTLVAGSLTPPNVVNSSFFYFRAQGFLIPPTTGLYTIGVNVQDGCNLFIGEKAIVKALTSILTANGTLAYNQSGTILLSAGVPYPLTIEWQHGAGVDSELQVIWTTPVSAGSITELIPDSCISSISTEVNGLMTGNWWAGTNGLWYPSGQGTIDFSNTNHPNKNLDYIPDGAVRKLLTGTGSGSNVVTGDADLFTAAANDIVITDGAGNVEDSGLLITALLKLSGGTMTGTLALESNLAIVWDNSSLGVDTGLSRLGAGVLAVGDGIAGNASGTLELANIVLSGTFKDSTGSVGTSGQVLTATGTGTEWATGGGGGFSNPMTAEGDMIYEDASLGPMRLPIGTSGQVLTVVSGLPAWAAAGGGSSVSINGSPVSSSNFQNSGSVTFSVSGSNIQLTATGGGGSSFPLTFVQQDIFQSGSSNVTSYTYNLPVAAAASGNTLFMLLGSDGSQSFTTPTGWTVDIDQQQPSYSRLVLMHKTSAADTSVSFTWGGPGSLAGFFFEVSGSHALDQFSAGGVATQQYLAFPSITPTAGAAVFGAIAITPGASSIMQWQDFLLPTWVVSGVQSILNNGGRGVLCELFQSAAVNAPTTPPLLQFPNQQLFGGGGLAYATFSIL